MRLNITSGTALRFEPGQQRKERRLAYQGTKQPVRMWGFRQDGVRSPSRLPQVSR